MSDMSDYLQKKAAELGLDRADQLSDIQTKLNQMFPNQCRALSLNDGVLRITTPNASVASELRFRQAELKTGGVTRVIIQIR